MLSTKFCKAFCRCAVFTVSTLVGIRQTESLQEGSRYVNLADNKSLGFAFCKSGLAANVYGLFNDKD